MEVPYEDGVWMNYDNVRPGLVLSRQELINRVRKAGGRAVLDCRIAVFLGDNEKTYAIDADYGMLFYNSVLFTPDNADELGDYAAQAMDELTFARGKCIRTILQHYYRKGMTSGQELLKAVASAQVQTGLGPLNKRDWEADKSGAIKVITLQDCERFMAQKEVKQCKLCM